MAECRICSGSYEPFISFGKMPIANGFLTPERFDDEYFFELQVGFCSACAMVQLIDQPDREMMFHGEYAFFSSTSTRMAQHFERFAKEVEARQLSQPDPFIVELGSNDGIMLRHFAEAGQRHLGVEPSANVAKVAIERGVNTISEFFDEDLAAWIVDEHGQADAVLAANVMCHIPYLHSVAASMKKLLKPDGVLMFEDPYLGDIVEKTSYDQIYDEHAFYFSVASVSALFSQHDLEVVDVATQDVHGGSMRYTIAHRGAKEISDAVAAQQSAEDALGLQLRGTYDELRRRIEKSRDDLMATLERLRGEGSRVVGYGATSKSTTVTNFCGITPEHIEFISDTTPIKQGKFSPGMHIPVQPYEDFSGAYPDIALLFAWNHAQEILANEGAFRDVGGQWLVYVPEVGIQDAG